MTNNRIGLGYDIHRFAKGRKLFLGGIEIPHKKGLQGHSDADVVLHAICDALLGAMGKVILVNIFQIQIPSIKIFLVRSY